MAKLPLPISLSRCHRPAIGTGAPEDEAEPRELPAAGCLADMVTGFAAIPAAFGAFVLAGSLEAPRYRSRPDGGTHAPERQGEVKARA